MSYNFLRNVNTITNSTLCKYDNLDGYSTDFHVNGNVDGWDVYSNIYVYGCWNGVLFGTAYERSCYISRNNQFVYVEAENYYTVKIMMKLTDNSDKDGLTTGRIQWTKISDSTWNSEKQWDFDIIADDKWHLYIINVGPANEWQGNINNLRIYPFIDGRPGDQFHIKYIKISSVNNYTCSNTQCSYYTKYNHPCPGAGVKASCEASLPKEYYTTLSGVNDSLIVNIDNYGSEEIYLGTNINISGRDIAKVIGVKLSQLNIGGYSYSEVEHTFFSKLKISSGSTGSNSSIVIEGGSAAYELGFFDIDSNDVSSYTSGIETESGFDYAPARRLKSFEINKLIDGSKESTAYLHDPNQYNVEGGKRNFVDSSTSNVGNTSAYLMYYTLFDNVGKTLIDVSHPINDSGKLKKIYVCGVVTSAASVLILRPHKNGDFTVLYELDLPVNDDSYLYTALPVNYRIDCDILVSKGDVIAVYNADVRTPICRRTDKPDAMFYQIDGKPSGRFDPGVCYAYGTLGFDLYARSDRLQTNILLDVDLGERVNIEEFNVYGRELNEYFEFNIACCLDLNWDINLFGETHWHHMSHAYSAVAQRNFEHINIAYGEECLDDGITTPDNGRQGDTFYGGGNSGSDITTVGHHSYFYVNGDGEWAYKYNQPGDSSCPKYEFCWPWTHHKLTSFKHDPIAFTILFPYEYEITIHKSIMYFKESDNFKHFALSYYLGSYDASGNADNPNFRYIPKYNIVSLDGVKYTENSPAESVFKDVASYVFNNPLPWPHARYENGECINWGIVQTAGNVHWNVISHEFDPITCKGFRIFCNYHNSTKINELELYSKVVVEPSLVDNTTIVFSDYGENWNDGSFFEDEYDSQKITSFVGGAPRYINIEIESQSEFNLYELELIVDDKVKLENCDDVFLLDDTTLNGVSDYSIMELENIYGKVCNLTVDLPKSIYVPNKVLSWMPLNSEHDVVDPPVGPGGLIHKNNDYNLRMNNSQIAINNYCYGLKNLIDGKESYVYEECETWNNYGTLSSGVSINYSNSDVSEYKKTLINFNAVSSKYWKLSSLNEYKASSLSLFYDDEELDIQKIYYFTATFGFYDSLIYTATGWNGFNIRLVIDSSLLEASSDTIKVVLSRANNLTWKFSSCFIGHASTIGDPYDFEDTPTRVTFGGNNGATIDSDHYESDSIAFNLNSSKNLVVSFYFTDGGYDDIPRTDNGIIPGVVNYYKSAADQSGDIDVTSYVAQADGRCLCISAILVDVEAEDGCNINAFASSDCDIVIEFLSSIAVDQIIMFSSEVIIALDIYVSSDNISYSKIASSTLFRLNPSDKNDYIVLSNNDLTATHGGSAAHRAARSMINKSSGKWYCEFTIDAATNNYIILGIGKENENLTYPGHTIAGYGYYGYNGQKCHSSHSSYGATYTIGNVIGMAVDLDNGKIWWSKNGVWQNSGDPAAGTGEAFSGISGIFYVMVSGYTSGDQVTTNFGKTPFQYSIPAGFSAFYAPPTGYEISIDINNYYRYFAIDLINRHDLDIIRNYGSLSNKLFLSTGVNIEYSNSDVDNVNIVNWNNSDHNDTRWIRISLLCGDGATRVLDKIGIYPDTTVPYCHDGGYNCEWQSMSTLFTNYDKSVNIALLATVSGSSYVEDFHPSNATDGIAQDYDYTLCWGFDADDLSPTLYLDFEDIYTIYKIDLYHGIGESNTDYQNVDYTISISTAASGISYDIIVTETSNTELYKSYVFNPVDVRRMKLTITNYTSGDVNFYQAGRHIFLNGGLLREIEVYTYVGAGYINSEDWPIVCVDLRHQFQLTGHELFNEYKAGGSDIEWDNTEEFFRYSDSIFDDPKKVSFFRDLNYVTVYSSSNTSEEMEEEGSYIFDSEVYLDFGMYEILWESYGATEEGELSLSAINGDYTIDSLNELTGAEWVNQLGTLEIPESGYYSIAAVHQFNSGNTCQVRNPLIRRAAGLIKWVSVKRDTATEYSYDDDSDKYGKDYLSRIKIYGNEKYNPFEYWWWWSSSIGNLSNDYLNVIEGSCSLEVNYPTSSGIDMVSFIEGDDFGVDDYFFEKDVLSFLWYIDNVNNLDSGFGAFYFGLLYSDNPVYSVWNIENLNLVSGWNRIKLKFDEYDSIEPSDTYGFNNSLDASLDFSSVILRSFRIRYRGVGNSLIMNFDDLKIQRNYFEDDVKFGKGLCLTDHDYLAIPSSDISLRCGTVEFWLKPYYNHEGYDVFGNAFSRNLFTLSNNSNDIISLGITSSSWFEIGFGNALTKYYSIEKARNDIVVDGGYFERNDVIHIALVWGHNGSYMDNGDTIRFYLNGVLLLVSKYTWEVSDTKSSSLIFGGSSASIAYNSDSYGGGIFDNIKVYNYCKTEFNINRIDVYGDLPTEPNDFIQISSDGINFYDNSDGVLPFVFEDILPGEKVPIYIRTNKDDGFRNSAKKTGNLIIDWVVPM